MNQSASPTQLAANNIAATHEAEGEAPRRSRGTEALRRVLAVVERALDRVDPEGADEEGLRILAAWHDALKELRTEVSRLLLREGVEPSGETGLLDSLRSAFSGASLRAVVQVGTRLLDLLSDAYEAAADTATRETLDHHRAGIVKIVNAAQDHIDG